MIAYDNIAYSDDHPRLCLDIYAPDEQEGYPVLMFVSGGSWQDGNRAWVAHLGAAFSPQGIGVVTVDHRVLPAATPHQQAADLALAFAWLKENIADYGGDPTRIIVGGHSAGGHLTSLMVLDENLLGAVGYRAADVGGVLALSGAFDGAAFLDADASPFDYIRPHLPPFLLLVAESDFEGVIRAGEKLHDALLGVGVATHYETIPQADHFSIVGDATALGMILAWMNTQFTNVRSKNT